MSRYGDTNPHFWLDQPDFPAPQHIQPEPRQPWDGHLHLPDHVQGVQQPDIKHLRPRQRLKPSNPPPLRRLSPSPSPPQSYRPQSPPQHHHHPSSPPRQHPIPRSRPVDVDELIVRPRHRLSPGPPRSRLLSPSSQPQSHRHPSPPRQHPIPPSRPVEGPQSPPQHHRASSPPPRQHPIPLSHPVEGPPLGSTQARPKPHSQHPRPHHVSFEHGAPPPRENLVYPTPTSTKPLTWFGAVFCVILWLVIILGGLLVLIIYLVYRPRTPHFEISSASLNAAYLDLGYLLNSDITVLANFTNPNKKVNVDFNYVVLQLYFDKHLIANQYIVPFSAFNTESKLANVEFVSSQVRLPLTVTQQLITQVQRNRISLEVDGIFHVRSNFGSLLRYSYWLYGHCQIELTGPPSGVMLTSHCRTKD